LVGLDEDPDTAADSCPAPTQALLVVLAAAGMTSVMVSAIATTAAPVRNALRVNLVNVFPSRLAPGAYRGLNEKVQCAAMLLC
jgi:hypothetical protein